MDNNFNRNITPYTDQSQHSFDFGESSINSDISFKEANHLKKIFIKCKVLSKANLEALCLMQQHQNILLFPYMLFNIFTAIINSDLNNIFNDSNFFLNYVKYITLFVLILNVFYYTIKKNLKINEKLDFFKNKYTKYKSICNMIEKYIVSGENIKTYDIITSNFNDIIEDDEYILPENIIKKTEKFLKNLDVKKKHNMEETLNRKKNKLYVKKNEEIYKKKLEEEIDTMITKIDRLTTMANSPRLKRCINSIVEGKE